MSEPAAVHDTFVLNRRCAASPARVFQALSDPALKKAWYADGGESEPDRFEMTFAIGGVEALSSRMGAATPFPGAVLSREGRIEDIVPDRRVVTTSTMSLAGRRISTSLETFELSPAADGACDLVFTHQAVFYPGSDGPQMRRGGWEILLQRLGDSLTA